MTFTSRKLGFLRSVATVSNTETIFDPIYELNCALGMENELFKCFCLFKCPPAPDAVTKSNTARVFMVFENSTRGFENLATIHRCAFLSVPKPQDICPLVCKFTGSDSSYKGSDSMYKVKHFREQHFKDCRLSSFPRLAMFGFICPSIASDTTELCWLLWVFEPLDWITSNQSAKHWYRIRLKTLHS